MIRIKKLLAAVLKEILGDRENFGNPLTVLQTRSNMCNLEIIFHISH